MAQGRKLQQWELRRHDDMELSHDESGSTSSAEPIFKKVKPVSDLMTTNTRKKNYKNRFELTKRKRVEESNKVQVMEHKMEDELANFKRPSYKGDLKGKRGRHERATASSNLIYMQSILEEIKVAQEKMLVKMRGEMMKILADSSAKQEAD